MPLADWCGFHSRNITSETYFLQKLLVRHQSCPRWKYSSLFLSYSILPTCPTRKAKYRRHTPDGRLSAYRPSSPKRKGRTSSIASSGPYTFSYKLCCNPVRFSANRPKTIKYTFRITPRLIGLPLNHCETNKQSFSITSFQPYTKTERQNFLHSILWAIYVFV